MYTHFKNGCCACESRVDKHLQVYIPYNGKGKMCHIALRKLKMACVYAPSVRRRNNATSAQSF